jgi:anionic cell wall polymer biosynthesis LytR-Cps2A-Psr (LCP) family protein
MYARSRHSTSDFDRSERQQQVIKAIKEKLS